MRRLVLVLGGVVALAVAALISTIGTAAARPSAGQGAANSNGRPALAAGVHYATHVRVVGVQQNAGPTVRPQLPAGYRYAANVRVLPAPTKRAGGSVTPDSASGCNPFFTPHTCIYVEGSGLHVSDWSTSSDITASCGQAFFEDNGLVIAYSYVLCDGPGYYYSDDGGSYFPNHTQLCNFWHGGHGRPCETVHS